MQAVLMSYSLAFALFPFAVFSLQQWLFRQPRMALVTLFFSSLLVAHTFFWVQSELIPACLYLLLGWSFLRSRSEKRIGWHWLWLLPLLFIGLSTHPLALISHLYIGAFFLLSAGKSQRPSIWCFTLAGPVIILIKWSFLSVYAYDATSMGLSQNAFLKFYRFFEWRSTRQFLGHCISLYLAFLPLFGWIIYSYWKSKEKKKLALFLVSTLGYLILVNGTYSWGGTIFHMEAFYQLLALFLALPLVYDLLPALSVRRASAITILLLTNSLLQVIRTSDQYQERTQWIAQTIDQYRLSGDNKVLLSQAILPMDTLLLEWGLPYETTLLSGLQKHANTFSAAVDLPNAPIEAWIKNGQVFLHTFGAIPYQELNRLPYWNFQDTTLYRIVDQTTPQKPAE